MLYDQHIEAVYLQALAELGSEDDAQDVAQEVFAIAWRKLGKIRLVSGSALPWLLTTCRNVTANRLRSNQRRPVTENLDDVGPTMADTEPFEKAVDSQHLVSRVEGEVATMSFLDQQVYRSVFHDGLSYDEAAEALSISSSSVRKRLNRVRTRLRAKFGEER